MKAHISPKGKCQNHRDSAWMTITKYTTTNFHLLLLKSLGMELLSRRRWTNGSAQKSDMCVLHIFLFFHKHNSLPLEPIYPSSPYTKELHGLGMSFLDQIVVHSTYGQEQTHFIKWIEAFLVNTPFAIQSLKRNPHVSLIFSSLKASSHYPTNLLRPRVAIN